MAAVISITPTVVPFDPSPSREFVRSTLAIVLIFLVVGEIGAFIYAGIFHAGGGDAAAQISSLKELVGLVLTPTLTLASAVMGFYYASKEDAS